MDSNPMIKNTVEIDAVKMREDAINIMEKKKEEIMASVIPCIEKIIIDAKNQGRLCMSWKMPCNMYDPVHFIYRLILKEFEKKDLLFVNAFTINMLIFHGIQ